ncbi:hypothetical protein B0H13DRAFT_2342444 [Mycena leptocephala]|nr:hypothetical protein B0H13DRAFT_2342444 [Mycena leptocephala]
MFVYTAVPGFFAQDDPLADTDAIGPVPPRFGLLDASDTRWATLSAKLRELNTQDAAVSYKLFFFGRHGKGYHAWSHKEPGTQFGTDWASNAQTMWGGRKVRRHWSKLNRDEEINWGPDAALTAKGKGEAAYANRVWKEEHVMAFPIPLPVGQAAIPSRAVQRITAAETLRTATNYDQRPQHRHCERRPPLAHAPTTTKAAS